ncbi:Aste57867_14856 [Aphanomyces stellatus]|uniref:Aste57867_14856 protein n=1 Tax=Aphanomyces stellatus TaxID=120398 RepID=A0A485L2N3_9STRA|nr:hypothetical protein As57867_014800 [Aphanomyces stellatus]VFT91674.1 Aste57867_14856 [Aphanomyces stellatus]
MQAIDRKVLEASLAAAIHEYARCVAVYTDLLTQTNADDWAFWLGLIDATLAIETPEALAHLTATIATLQAQHGTTFRGPWLAELELAFRQLQRGATPAFVHELVVPYMDRFASKTCCVTDLQRYVGSLDAAARAALVAASHDRLATALASQEATTGDVKTQTKWFKQALLARKMLRLLGDHTTLSTADALARVEAMLQEYHANQWLNQTSVGGQREVQVTDDLLLLTVLLYVDVYVASADTTDAATRRAWLLHAATCLEFGLGRSAYNFQMKMLLCRVYALLGAGDAVVARYDELDVKQIQLDSLSYLIVDPLLALGHVEYAKTICDNIRSLHRSTARDTPEFIARAYRLGVFSKAQDMTGFLLHKMQRSQMLALATSELVHLQLADLTRTTATHLQNQFLLQPLPHLADLERFVRDADRLSRNHHREVQVDWTLATPETTGRYVIDGRTAAACDRTTADPVLFKRWLELRVVVPQILAASYQGNATEVAARADEFKAIVHGLETDETAAVWAVAATAVDALARISQDDAAAGGALLDQVAAQVKALDVIERALGDEMVSGHGLSHASLWLYHVSPYVLVFVALAAKHLKPKKKAKADASTKDCVDRLKHYVAAHVEWNQHGIARCKTFKPIVVVPDHAVVQEAVEAVKTKVTAAQAAAVGRVQGTLVDHVSFLRSL